VKILAIGDPHGSMDKLRKIPTKGVDLILLTGDLGKADLIREHTFKNIERKKQGLKEERASKSEYRKMFMEIYGSSMDIIRYCARFAPTYFICGNVEPDSEGIKRWEKNVGRKLPIFTREAQKLPNVRVINNRIINFKGVRIGGLEYFVDTNWVQEFKPSGFKKAMKKAKKQTDKAKKVLRWFNQYQLDILVHHQPPYGFLDKVGPPAPKQWRGKHAGSKTILDFIRKNQPSYTFCGHIHEGEGSKKIGRTQVSNLGVCGYKILEF